SVARRSAAAGNEAGWNRGRSRRGRAGANGDHFGIRPGVSRQDRRAGDVALSSVENFRGRRAACRLQRQFHDQSDSEVGRVLWTRQHRPQQFSTFARARLGASNKSRATRPMSVAIIINPISGTGGRDARRARAELASAALTARGAAGEVFVTERKGHGRELAAAAVTRGARLVVAWGGDGTVNE